MRLDANDPRPPFVQVADALRVAISGGEMAPGEKLPSIRELSERYGVAPMTVQHALRLLRDDGWIVSWQGRGSYVRERPDQEETTAGPPEAGYDELIKSLGQIQEQVRDLGERVSRIERRTDEE